MLLPEDIPDYAHELSTVLDWASLSPGDLFTKPILLRLPSGASLVWVGTRKFGDGIRVLLTDSLTLTSIRALRVSESSSTPAAEQEPPLPELQPIATRDYAQLVVYELAGLRHYLSKEWTLRLGNGRRERKTEERLATLHRGRELTHPSVAREEGKVDVVISLAVCAYEKGLRKKKRVLDIGWAKWTVGDKPSLVKVTHVLIKDHAKLRNGVTRPDRKDAFAFGTSRRLSLSDALTLLVAELSAPGVTIVGNTLRWSRAVLGLPRPDQAFDTGDLFRTIERDQTLTPSVEDLLKHYRLPHKPRLLHNAGNDALCALQIFQAISSKE